jgi:hypothetical protein
MGRQASLNKIDVVKGSVPWDWHNLGAVYGHSDPNNQCVAARCSFTVRRGFDAAEGVDYGRVVEGVGALGLSLRAKDYAFTLSADNLSFSAGPDEPLRAQSIIGNTLASLKVCSGGRAAGMSVSRASPGSLWAWPCAQCKRPVGSVARHLSPPTRAVGTASTQGMAARSQAGTPSTWSAQALPRTACSGGHAPQSAGWAPRCVCRCCPAAGPMLLEHWRPWCLHSCAPHGAHISDPGCTYFQAGCC